MNIFRSGRPLSLMLCAVFSTVFAGTAQVELSPSYEATREKGGDVVLMVTVSAKAHMVGGGVEIPVPMSRFLDQAAKKECPRGYSLQGQDPQETHVVFGVPRWTQRSVIRCHDA